jgi:glycosyltransferase involved in cell wall biosynthesis
MEAMAAKRAIIASAVGGIPEMIENNKNGLLVSPANVGELTDACIKLARDKSFRDSLGEQGSIIAHEKFEIQNVVSKLSNLYDELIKNGR